MLTQDEEVRLRNLSWIEWKKFSSQVFTTSLLGETMVVFCGSGGNKLLFSNEIKLVRVWHPKTMDNIFPFNTSTRRATNLRIYVMGFLKPEALQRYIGIINSAAKIHLDMKWSNQKQVTVGTLVKDYAFSLACKLFLNLEDPIQIGKTLEPFLILISGLFSIPINLPGTSLNLANNASAVLRKNILEIIKQRKIHLAENRASPTPTQDILSHMLLTSDQNGALLPEMNISEMILGLLLGGHDTVTGAITFLIKYLAELPDVYTKVLTEQMEIANSKGAGELLNWGDIYKMKYPWNVVCEVMRLAPPVQGTFREAFVRNIGLMK